MGYTHYFPMAKEIPQDQFSAFAEDCRKIIKHAQDVAGIELDIRKVNDQEVWFNGVGDDAHETFVVERRIVPESWQERDEGGLYLNFCKTNKKPYDVAVTACLIALDANVEACGLGSDGWASEWEAGKALFAHATGKEPSDKDNVPWHESNMRG